MIYLIVPAVFTLFILLQNKIGKKVSSKVAFTMSFFVIFLLLVLRSSSVGIDTSSYVNNFFIRFGQSNWQDIFKKNNEWGFAILCKLTYMIWPNQQFFFAVVGLLCTLPICIMYSKNIEEAPIISLMIFLSMSVFSMMFSGMRQAIAIAIICTAYKPLTERHFIRYALLVILATMFHASAIVALIFYFVYAIPLSQRSCIITFALIGLITIFSRQIIDAIVKLMYAISDKYENYKPGETNAYMAAIVYMVILIILYFFNPLFGKNNQMNSNHLIGSYPTTVIKNGFLYDKKINILLTLIVVQIFASVHFLAARVSMYIVSWLPMVVSEYFDSFKYTDANENKIIFSLGFFLVFIYQFINDIVIHGGLGLLPYVPFWG